MGRGAAVLRDVCKDADAPSHELRLGAMFNCSRKVIAVTCFMLSITPVIAQVLPQAEAFSSAVEKADVEQVRIFLQQEPRLAISRTSDGWPVFLQQSIFFSPEILDLLLKNGADPNVRNAEGETLLHLIADPVAIRLLLAAGANIEARDNKGWTPLMSHASYETTGPDAIYTLLAEGADPEAQGPRGETAASLLPEGRQFEMMKETMQRQAQPGRQ